MFFWTFKIKNGGRGQGGDPIGLGTFEVKPISIKKPHFSHFRLSIFKFTSIQDSNTVRLLEL
jgi:hypothetical protein